MNEQVKAIRNEIERRMEKHWDLLPDADSPEDDWTHNEFAELGAYKELEHLETFVDSLPEETDNEEPNRPKLSDTLEEAAEEHVKSKYCLEKLLGAEIKEAVNDFIAGAQWQKDRINIDISKQVAAAFQLGEKSKEEQMMKDAVEGTVHNFSSNKPHPTVLMDAKGFNQGDKVRVIIVKEDEQ